MFKRREIQKQEKKEEVLVNPMSFETERMTNKGEHVEIKPIYLLTDKIMNNVLSSNEIYTKRGTISYSVRNNIQDTFYNRIVFLIKNEFFRIIDEIRINMINDNIFEKSFESDMNEIFHIGIRLFSKDITTRYNNTLESRIINSVSPILGRKLNGDDSIYSIDLLINNIVEFIYNEYMAKIEETIFSLKAYCYEREQLTAEQLSILYNIPTAITVQLGLSLGVILNEFIDYKQEKIGLIDKDALKLRQYDEDDY